MSKCESCKYNMKMGKYGNIVVSTTEQTECYIS